MIESQLITYGPKHVEAEMRMWDKDRSVLKALTWLSFVHFDLKTNRPVEHSPEYMQLFEKVVLTVEEKGFGERVKGVR